MKELVLEFLDIQSKTTTIAQLLTCGCIERTGKILILAR
jgi:hypothetical protein